MILFVTLGENHEHVVTEVTINYTKEIGLY